MEIVIFQSVHKQNHMNKDEVHKSSKHRLGCKPVTMSQEVRLKGIRSKINRAFKNDVARALRKAKKQLRHDVSCIVRTDYGVFRIVPRTPEAFANRLANLILLQTKARSNEYGVVKREDVTSMANVIKPATKKAK